MDSVNTELIRGHVDTIILNSLAERDRYGYEILDIISDLSEGRYEIKQPTLYSCLKRLEKQGFIESYFGDESNGGRRRYYKLTEKGRETLEQDQREWEFSRTIINKLLSDREIDLKTVEAPFDPNELRPLTRRVKAHDVSEEVASALPHTQEPIIKYVYVPQYIRVADGSPMPESAPLPEGAVIATQSEIQQEVAQQNLESVQGQETATFVNNNEVIPPTCSYFSAILNPEKEDLPIPTEQEALNALYAEPSNPSPTNTSTLGQSEVANANEQNASIDEEEALLILEQQTNASRVLGIGEFAQPRNLLEDPSETSSITTPPFTPLGNTRKRETEEINYREALSALYGTQGAEDTIQQASATYQAEVERMETSAKAKHFGDVKQSLYEDGFKLKVYQKANTLNHYYLKFIYSNRINRDTALLTYLVLAVELLVMIIAKSVFGSPITYLIIGGVGVLVPLIPTLVWVMNPTKRIRAQFNFTQALSNSFIAFIIICAITIVISLLLDANMKAGVTYAPIIIAFNIPVGVAIYGTLYKSNNYHLKK